jgi:hypothetical protein
VDRRLHRLHRRVVDRRCAVQPGAVSKRSGRRGRRLFGELRQGQQQNRTEWKRARLARWTRVHRRDRECGTGGQQRDARCEACPSRNGALARAHVSGVVHRRSLHAWRSS